MGGRCMYDGYHFKGPPFLLPLDYNVTTKSYTFENVMFCSPECGKAYLCMDTTTRPSRFALLSMYTGCDSILCAPDRRFLTEYMPNGARGMSIDEFRSRTRRAFTNYYHIQSQPRHDIDDNIRVVYENETKTRSAETTTSSSLDSPRSGAVDMELT